MRTILKLTDEQQADVKARRLALKPTRNFEIRHRPLDDGRAILAIYRGRGRTVEFVTLDAKGVEIGESLTVKLAPRRGLEFTLVAAGGDFHTESKWRSLVFGGSYASLADARAVAAWLRQFGDALGATVKSIGETSLVPSGRIEGLGNTVTAERVGTHEVTA